jgi:hypothetical protein
VSKTAANAAAAQWAQVRGQPFELSVKVLAVSAQLPALHHDNTTTSNSASSNKSSDDDVRSDVATAWLPLGPLAPTTDTINSSSSNSSSNSISIGNGNSGVVLGEGMLHGADVLSLLPLDYYPVALQSNKLSDVASSVKHTTDAVITATAARVGIRMRMLFPEECLPDVFTDVAAAAADIVELRSLSNAASKGTATKNTTLNLSQELMLTLSGHGVVGSNSGASSAAVKGVSSEHYSSLDSSEQARRHKAEVSSSLHMRILSAAVYVHVFVDAMCCCHCRSR